MRKSLLGTFDKIYILNLHGNSRKKEIIPGDGRDENVFDIQQGVSINIFVKSPSQNKENSGKVFYYDLYNKREHKYQFLLENTLNSVQWAKLCPKEPYYFFTPKDFSNKAEYQKGFSVSESFKVFNSGIKTDRDSLFIDTEKKSLGARIEELLSGKFDRSFAERYNVKDSSSYKITEVIKNERYNQNNIHPLLYRPFDKRYIYYQMGLISRPAESVMRNVNGWSNAALITCRFQDVKGSSALISDTYSDIRTFSNPGSIGTDYVFPLYLYPDADALDRAASRRPNLDKNIIDEITAKTGFRFTDEKEDTENTFAPVDILDYIYAVLYSNNYRKKYAEYLKIDFPRIPYPQNTEQFHKLAATGSILRNLHLMENVSPSLDLADFPVVGSNEIETVHYKDSKVFINKTQYFSDVPSEAWHYFIGGYQPSEKWLKDRKGRVLSFDDIEHYRKIVFVLITTIKIQQQIDEALV
jgi:predicted helicase